MKGQAVNQCDRAGGNRTSKISRPEIEKGFAKQSKEGEFDSAVSWELLTA